VLHKVKDLAHRDLPIMIRISCSPQTLQQEPSEYAMTATSPGCLIGVLSDIARRDDAPARAALTHAGPPLVHQVGRGLSDSCAVTGNHQGYHVRVECAF